MRIVEILALALGRALAKPTRSEACPGHLTARCNRSSSVLEPVYSFILSFASL